jgi:MFS family permease
LLEVERNLFFLILDSAAFVTVLALMLEAEGTGMAAAWPNTLSAFMLNGAPENSGAWGTAVGIVGAVAGVTLIGAGLGLIIGAIGDRLHRSGEMRRKASDKGRRKASDKASHEETCTGPTRPPPPWDEPGPG